MVDSDSEAYLLKMANSGGTRNERTSCCFALAPDATGDDELAAQPGAATPVGPEKLAKNESRDLGFSSDVEILDDTSFTKFLMI